MTLDCSVGNGTEDDSSGGFFLVFINKFIFTYYLYIFANFEKSRNTTY